MNHDNQSLKFLYTNADQFVNKRDALIAMIADDEPDVIMITEVIPKGQVNPIANASLHLNGFKIHTNFKPEDSNLGASGIRGVMIYFKESLNASEVDIKIEGLEDHAWIQIPGVNNESLLCGCVYRSPSDSDQKSSLVSTKKINQLVKAACDLNPNILIAGDFNFKEIDWINEYSPPGKQHLIEFINTIQECFLFQHVTEPTRFRENENPNLLDLILSNEEGMVQDLSYLPPLEKSDHVCLKFSVIHKKQLPTPTSPIHNIFKANYELIGSELDEYNWNELLNGSFIEDYKTFTDILSTKVKKHSPLKTHHKKKRNLYSTREVLRLKNAKRRAWDNYKKTPSSYNLDKFKRSRNKLRSLTRTLRKNFELNLARNIKGNPKLFWKYASSRLKSRQAIPSLDKENGDKAVTDKEKADNLNTFFTSVFTIEDKDTIPSVTKDPTIDSLLTIDVTPKIVLDKLLKLNPNKSQGHDKMHPHFLKKLAHQLAVPLSILLKKSLKEGADESWCRAIITAIFKKGKKSSPDNYRPVSLTSVISKVMESIIRDAMLDHLMKHDILADPQHGFVPGRDCMTQLLLCLDEWTQMIEDNKAFDVIYTDFAKAFDSVAHQRLLVKLQNYGIGGDVLNWIRSFLCNRKQSVRVNQETSSWTKVLSGIPQGSVLGPLLFVIFINDMPDEVKFNMCKLFADDCKLYGEVNISGTNKVQDDLSNLEKWSKKWQLPFNVKKCKVMHMGSKNPNHEYTMNGQKLDVSVSEKDLGVHVDNQLKFHVHSAAATKKGTQILGLIKKTYKTRDADSITTLYKSLVRPHLEYGNIIWGPIFKEDMKSVEKIQQRATKIISQLRDVTYEERLKALDLPSLYYRRRRGDMILMYKIMNEKVRIEASTLFTPATYSRTRGHKQKISKKKATKVPRMKSFTIRTVNDWNNLPIDVIESPSINAFKNRLDKFWDGKQFNTD